VRVDRASLSRYLSLKLHAAGHATSQVQGNRRSPQRGRGVEFADYRAYDQGDDIRLVDWNVYLRLGVALVKQFTEERSLSLRICVDTSESMAFGEPRKADHAAQIAAALAMVALGQREPVTLVCAGGGGKAARARAVNLDGMAELLMLLERTEPGGQGKLRSQLSAQLDQSRSDVLVLISDLLFDDDEREALLRLCVHSSHAPAVIHVVGKDELEPFLDDVGRVVDAETGEELVLPDGARAAYEQVLADWLGSIEDRCRRLGVNYLRVPTQVSVDAVMTGSLHKSRLIEHRSGGAR
jgi:uncharacterized protein (DUF58 family)